MMSDRLLRILLALLGAIAVHLGYVLFMPGREMDGIITRFAAAHRDHAFVLLAPEAARDHFQADLPGMATAACSLDASGGPVVVETQIPAPYWIISLYSGRGELLFTLDDRQAGPDRARFVLAQPGDGADVPAAGTISVELPSARGLALVQARANGPEDMARLRAALANSTCRPQRP